MLQGRSPGVPDSRGQRHHRFRRGCRRPGASARFNLGRNPLIYVDGIRVNNDGEAGPSTGGERVVNVFNDFNPADIESIEIIKGPAAADAVRHRGLGRGDPDHHEAGSGGRRPVRRVDPSGRQLHPGSPGPYRHAVGRAPTPSRRRAAQMGPISGAAGQGAGGRLVAFNMPRDLDEILDLGTEACARSLEDPMCWNQYWTKGPASEGKWPQENIFQYGQSQTYDLGVRGGTSSVRYFLQASYTEGRWHRLVQLETTCSGAGPTSVWSSTRISRSTCRPATSRATPGSAIRRVVRVASSPSSAGAWATASRRSATATRPQTPAPGFWGFQEHLPTDHQQVEADAGVQALHGELDAELHVRRLALVPGRGRPRPGLGPKQRAVSDRHAADTGLFPELAPEQHRIGSGRAAGQHQSDPGLVGHGERGPA